MKPKGSGVQIRWRSRPLAIPGVNCDLRFTLPSPATTTCIWPTPFPPLPLGYLSVHISSLPSANPHYSSHLSPYYHLSPPIFFQVLLSFDHILSSSSLQSYLNASYLPILTPHEWQTHLLVPWTTVFPRVPFCIIWSWRAWPWEGNLDLLSAWLTMKLASQKVYLHELSDHW